MSGDGWDGSTLPGAPAGEAAPVAVEAPPGARYAVSRRIGVGGMGEVWLAHDAVLDHPVALKVLAAHLAPDPAWVDRFLREARLTAGLEHPGIVPVHDIGRWGDGRPFYAMKVIEGEDLDQHILALHAGPPDPAALRRLIDAFSRAVEAVAYAHARGVVHRDLKPRNLRLGRFGEVVVLDWGLGWAGPPPGAAEEPGDGRTQAARGTPGYMPPEQRQGGARPAPTWDVYALGATLFEILSGARPGPGRALPGQADEGLAALCRAAMQPDPAMRPPDAGALADALQRWLDGAQRRERALARVAEAAQRLPEVENLYNLARQRAEAARDRLEQSQGWQPIQARIAAWALEDEAAAARRQAELAEVQALQLLQGALGHDADSAEAHRLLADLHQRAQARAEAEGDAPRAAREAALLAGHDREGRHRAWRAGEAWLSLRTEPPGAEVALFRFEERRRRLVPVFAADLGPTPLLNLQVERGSWLLRARLPGYAELLYPVALDRLETWDLCPPGQAEPWPVPLLAEGALGPDEVYVPAGWFRAGGDDQASRGWPAHRRWAPGFVMRRRPVCNAEYLDFLNRAAEAGALDPAWAPRERVGAAGGAPASTFAWDGRRFSLGAGVAGLPLAPDDPVVQITWHGAAAFAAAEAARTGQPWRLPREAELEKAARGVDGRRFPTGALLDPSWTWVRESAPSQRGPVSVHRPLQDESPYGLTGLSGNVRTWCEDAEGPTRLARGGAWSFPVAACRAAARSTYTPDTRIENLGLRLVRPVD